MGSVQILTRKQCIWKCSLLLSQACPGTSVTSYRNEQCVKARGPGSSAFYYGSEYCWIWNIRYDYVCTCGRYRLCWICTKLPVFFFKNHPSPRLDCLLLPYWDHLGSYLETIARTEAYKECFSWNICSPWWLGNRSALQFVNHTLNNFLSRRSLGSFKLRKLETRLLKHGAIYVAQSAHFSIKATNLGPGELLQETCRRWISARLFNECLDIKTVDINPYQREATDYFVKKKKDFFARRHSFG